MKKSMKRVLTTLVILIIILSVNASDVFATPGSDYNKSRSITINMAGGNAPTMRWMYKYDRTPPSGASPNTYRNGVATGNVYDKYGTNHRLGLMRGEIRRPAPLNVYPFPNNQNPRVGTFTQHMDFVGQTPYIWLANPTRTGYSFDGWTTSPSRTQLSHNGGTLVHAGLSGGNFTITARWVDKTAPTGSFSPNSRGWGNTSVSVTISGSDSGSGVRRIRYRTETNGTWGSYNSWANGSSRSVNLTTAGNRRIQAQIEDNAGNIRTITSGYYRIDTTAPNATFSPNSSSWTNKSIDTVITPTDSGGSGVRRMRWRASTNNGSSYGAWSSWINGSGSYTLPITTQGERKVQVQVEDNAGNTRTVTSGTFYIDKTAPVHLSDSILGARHVDENNYWIRPNDTVQIRVRGQDNHSGINVTYLSLNNHLNRAHYTWSNGTYSEYVKNSSIFSISAGKVIANSTAKEYEFNVKATGGEINSDVRFLFRDRANNYSDPTASSYTWKNTGKRLRVDGTGPTVEFSSLKNIDTGHILLTTKTTDSGSGVDSVKYKITESTAKPADWETGDVSFDIYLTEPGDYYMHVEATDNVGNVSYTRSNKIEVEETLGIRTLTMTNLVNPPEETLVPIHYPVSIPPNIKVGYKMSFIAEISKADEVEVKIYTDGSPVKIYTDEGAVDTIVIPTKREDNYVEYTFWVDKETEIGTVLDMVIDLNQKGPGGDKTITNEELGKGFGKVSGTAKRDANINLTN